MCRYVSTFLPFYLINYPLASSSDTEYTFIILYAQNRFSWSMGRYYISIFYLDLPQIWTILAYLKFEYTTLQDIGIPSSWSQDNSSYEIPCNLTYSLLPLEITNEGIENCRDIVGGLGKTISLESLNLIFLPLLNNWNNCSAK